MGNVEFCTKHRALIEEYLTRAIPVDGLSDINKAMRYSLLAGGKRLRPLLLLSAAAALGAEAASFLPVACGLELIHTYSLIHDDLPAMDDDDYRRGRLTNHKVFGEAKAILAGDALLTAAFEVMLKQTGVPCSVLIETVREIAFYSGGAGMVGGQTLDLEAEKNIISAETLEKMHMAKTGALFKAALLAGGRLAGASAAQLDALERYAANFGIAFQITDDVLDVIGDAKKMGKTPGSDERKNKYTYVSAYGLDEAEKMAVKHVEAAVAAVAVFGDNADPLVYLVETLIKREN